MSPSLSRRVRVAAPLTIPALLLAACGDPVGIDVEPITELPRALSVAEIEVVERSNDFGLELLGEVLAEDERDNVILSPLSASMALGMTLNGANEATFDAMRSGLGFGSLDQEEINTAYRGLIDLLTSLDPSVQFEIGNSIWAREGIPFHQSFFDAVAEGFDAQATALDFDDAGSVDVINAWVEDRTNGLIDRVIDQLSSSLVMLLINAIYFDGTWTDRFDPADTSPQDFHRADGTSVTVDMMSISNVEFDFGGGIVDGVPYAAVDLPYGGGAFSMLVVVPYEDPYDFAGQLDGESLDSIIGSLSPTVVDGVAIPKFELSYDTYLNDPLKRMGMEVAFTPAADFSRMSPLGDDMCIAFVRQKTFMEVDERGTRAAAVTSVGIGPVSFTGLIADQPFLIAIRERLSGTILFLGVVGDPTAGDSTPPEYEDSCG